MGVARFAAILLAAVLCPLLAQAESKEGKIKEGQEELFRSVLRHNAAARERIKSYIIEQEWTEYEPKALTPDAAPGAAPGAAQGGQTGSHSMRIVQKGEHMFLTRSGRLEAESGAWSQDQSIQAVLNDRYFAEYMRVPPIMEVKVWDHESIRNMNSTARALATSWSSKPSALDFMCGAGETTLMDIFQISTEKAVWSISDAVLDGEAVYKISMNRVLSNGQTRAANYYIDPSKNFLLCGWEQVLSDKNEPAKLRIKLAHWGEENGWFPKTIEYKGAADYPYVFRMTIKSVAINPTDFEESFSLDEFDIADGTYMNRYVSNGSKAVAFKFKDGVWVQLSTAINPGANQ